MARRYPCMDAVWKPPGVARRYRVCAVYFAGRYCCGSTGLPL